MKLPAKFGLGTLTVGTVTGISTAVGIGVHYSNPEEVFEGIKPISEIVETQYDYILLDAESNDSAWQKILEKYKTKNEGKGKWEDELKLKNWKSEDDNKLLTEIKQKCEKFKKGRANTTEDKLYTIITTYCARGVTISEQAAKDGLRVADTGFNKDGNIWGTRQGGFSTMTKELATLGVTGNSISSTKIREACGATKEKK